MQNYFSLNNKEGKIVFIEFDWKSFFDFVTQLEYGLCVFYSKKLKYENFVSLLHLRNVYSEDYENIVIKLNLDVVNFSLPWNEDDDALEYKLSKVCE